MRPYKSGGTRYTSRGKGASLQDYGLARRIRGKNPQKKKYQQILQTIPNDGRRLRPEVKIVDLPAVTHLFGAAMVLNYLNCCREGAGFWNRIGRKINMKSLYITGFVSPNNTNAAAAGVDYNRIIVFYDRQPNAAVITYDNIVQSVDQLGTGTSSLSFDHINMNNRERFIVLMDRRIVTPPIGIAGVTATNANFTIDTNFGDSDQGMKITRFIKLQDLETTFKSNTDPCTIADISTGALGILTIATSSGTARAWNFNYSARLKFYDV